LIFNAAITKAYTHTHAHTHTHSLSLSLSPDSLLSENISTIKNSEEILVQASKEIDLELNADKSKYMKILQNQNFNIYNIDRYYNKSFETV
jgi:hypothetical protein